jgi:hypothetical protein
MVFLACSCKKKYAGSWIIFSFVYRCCLPLWDFFNIKKRDFKGFCFQADLTSWENIFRHMTKLSSWNSRNFFFEYCLSVLASSEWKCKLHTCSVILCSVNNLVLSGYFPWKARTIDLAGGGGLLKLCCIVSLFNSCTALWNILFCIGCYIK